jgi:hypothetical protein
MSGVFSLEETFEDTARFAHGVTLRSPAVFSVDVSAGGKEHLAQIKLTIADRPKQGSPLAEI